MKQHSLKKLVQETKGKFFSITFIKKDGSERVACARARMDSELRGGEFTGANAGYVPVYDRNAKHWISVHPSRVKSFKCGKVNLVF